MTRETKQDQVTLVFRNLTRESIKGVVRTLVRVKTWIVEGRGR